MEEKCALSPSMLVAFQMLRSDDYYADDGANRQLAVVPQFTTANANTSRFTLPDGWVVQRVPRRDGSRVDKYYFEPETGQRFRSLKAVERYMKGEVYSPKPRAFKNSGHRRTFQASKKSSGYRKTIISGGKQCDADATQMLRLDKKKSNHCQLAVKDHTMAATSTFNLPDGSVVEEVPSRCGGFTDEYYYEPGTGRKFRSLVTVKRHLGELTENTPLSKVGAEFKGNEPSSNVFKLGNHVQNCDLWKENISREKVQTSPFSSPPMKMINWVLSSPGRNTIRSPFIGEMLVPETVKQQCNGPVDLCSTSITETMIHQISDNFKLIGRRQIREMNTRG